MPYVPSIGRNKKEVALQTPDKPSEPFLPIERNFRSVFPTAMDAGMQIVVGSQIFGTLPGLFYQAAKTEGKHLSALRKHSEDPLSLVPLLKRHGIVFTPFSEDGEDILGSMVAGSDLCNPFPNVRKTF